MKYFSDQVALILISQLIKCSSRILQKILKRFNGTANATCFVASPAAILSVSLFPNLKGSKFAVVGALLKVVSSL